MTDINTDVSLKLPELKFKDNDLENMNLEIALNKNKANINLKEIVTIGGFENALIKFSNLAENLRLNHKKSKSEELDLSYEHSFSSVELKQKKKLVELTPYINNTKLEAIVLRDHALINVSKFSLVNKILFIQTSTGTFLLLI